MATAAPVLPIVKAPVAEASPTPHIQRRPRQAELEIGRPEDTGMVQVNTQLKSFEPVEIKVEAATRRRRSDVKPLEASTSTHAELVMVETSHSDKA